LSVWVCFRHASPEMGAAMPRSDPVQRCRFCNLPLSSAESHEELCSNLRLHGILGHEAAAAAYEAVDRADFVPLEYGDPYVDAAIVLGAGAQISAPHVHTSALNLLAERLPTAPGRCRVLDIGAGSGCMCALLACLLKGKGEVLAIEHIEELAASARENVAKHHGALLAAGGPLDLRWGDAQEVTEPEELAGAFDLVHCGAALPDVEAWLTRLLRPGGRAVAPLGPTDAPQWLCTIDKGEDGCVVVTRHIRVLYVPVTSAAAQRQRGDEWDEVVDRCRRNSDLVLAQERSQDAGELHR